MTGWPDDDGLPGRPRLAGQGLPDAEEQFGPDVTRPRDEIVADAKALLGLGPRRRPRDLPDVSDLREGMEL